MLETITEIKRYFEITDMGSLKLYLGIQIEKSNGLYYMHEEKYINKILETFNMSNSKPSKIPLDTGYFKILNDEPLESNEIYRKVIGSLLYLSGNTRPDIAAAVSILSRKVSCPTQNDWNEVKRVLRYLQIKAK